MGLTATGPVELLLAIVTGSVGLLGDAIHNLSDVSTSAVFAGAESVRKLIEHGHTTHVGWSIVGAVIGILGNQVVARYKLAVGQRIGSATLMADARHSWLDALSSAGALVICHVGYEVTRDVVYPLADSVDPEVIQAAETAAGSVPGVVHAHAGARWTGRTLRVEIEGWIGPDLTARDSDALGRRVADAIAEQLPEAGSLTWATRAAP